MVSIKTTSKRLFFAFLTFYTLTVSSMESSSIDIPSKTTNESEILSKRAVELYFRGNAQSIRTLLLPLIAAKVDKAFDVPIDFSLLSDLQDMHAYDACNVSLPDHIHALVTQSIEEAIKEKELQLQQREEQSLSQKRQRNIAIVTALVTVIGGAGAVISTLTQLA